jgi:hypothetical protein
MNRYIVLDTETGGVTLDTSLLTAFFAILNEDFEVTDELYLRVKPDDGIYRTTARALEINGINLISHDAVAITLREARTPLYEFLRKNYSGHRTDN